MLRAPRREFASSFLCVSSWIQCGRSDSVGVFTARAGVREAFHSPRESFGNRHLICAEGETGEFPLSEQSRRPIRRHARAHCGLRGQGMHASPRCFRLLLSLTAFLLASPRLEASCGDYLKHVGAEAVAENSRERIPCRGPDCSQAPVPLPDRTDEISLPPVQKACDGGPCPPSPQMAGGRFARTAPAGVLDPVSDLLLRPPRA